MSDEWSYHVRSVWPDGPPSEPAEIGQRFLATLASLQRLDSPTFNNWELSDRTQDDLIPLERARTQIADIVEDCVARDDYGEPYPVQGYSVTAFNLANGVKKKVICVNVRAANAYGCHAEMEVGDSVFVQDASGEHGYWAHPVDPALLNFTLFKGALLTFVEHWPCHWAEAYVFKSNYWKTSSAPGVPPHAHTSFHIPWITYLPPKFTKGFTPPVDIPSEKTPDGGLLMWVTEERLDLTNPQHMKRSRAIAEIMIERTNGGSVNAVDIGD